MPGDTPSSGTNGTGGSGAPSSARSLASQLTAGWPNPASVRPAAILGNLIVFAEDLRMVGIPVGSGQVLNMIEAVATVDIRRRREVYQAMRTTSVTRPEQLPLFDDRFATFWERLGMGTLANDEGGSIEIDGPPPPGSQEGPPKDKEPDEGGDESKSTPSTVVVDSDESDGMGGEVDSVPDDVMLFSADESLRSKDFALLTDEELAEARRFISQMTWQLGRRLTRRLVAANNGMVVDQRRTLRHALRHGGIPIDLRHRKRKERMRPLILICDISGSMDRYSRLLLRFVHALEHGLDNTEVFVFSTRLTRITRELRTRDVDGAIAEVTKSVQDWSGGTRIGEAIKDFNFRWSRRVLRSGATVIVISDGWDRGDPQLLADEMARLQRSCRRLIWLNPLLGSPGYQPLTRGMKAALPYTDYFLPIHNMKSMEALSQLLGRLDDQPPLRQARGKAHEVPKR